MIHAILPVFQPEKDSALVDGVPDGRHRIHDIGIMAHHVGHSLLQLHHVLERNALLRFGKRECQVLIFVGNEAGLRDRVQVEREPDHHE